ncbi:MAG: histidine phosphatase family protein [Anaerolineae bacterium]
MVDPYTAPLSPRGISEAAALADACVGWGIQFLCVSTAVRAEQTADQINKRLPDILRWDLKELEPPSVDDMEGQVIFSANPGRWSPEQYRYGVERTWIRLMAALARIDVYAATWGIERIALVTHSDIINLCLYNWLGLDWTHYQSLQFSVDYGKSCRVLQLKGKTSLEWLNCL